MWLYDSEDAAAAAADDFDIAMWAKVPVTVKWSNYLFSSNMSVQEIIIAYFAIYIVNPSSRSMNNC